MGVLWPELGLGVASLILCAGQCLLSELRSGCCVFDPCAGPVVHPFISAISNGL